MCIENDKLMNNLKNNEKDIMEAVAIIKSFEPDIKMINSMLIDHSKRIDEEVNERKEENKIIRDNYIKRFDDLKADIKEIRKDIKNSFFGISIFILTTFIGFFLSKIFGVL